MLNDNAKERVEDRRKYWHHKCSAVFVEPKLLFQIAHNNCMDD